MKTGVFIETENVTRFRAAVAMAEDTERGRPGMVMAYGEAGRGKTIAAENAFCRKRRGVFAGLGKLDPSRLSATALL